MSYGYGYWSIMLFNILSEAKIFMTFFSNEATKNSVDVSWIPPAEKSLNWIYWIINPLTRLGPETKACPLKSSGPLGGAAALYSAFEFVNRFKLKFKLNSECILTSENWKPLLCHSTLQHFNFNTLNRSWSRVNILYFHQIISSWAEIKIQATKWQ